MSHGYRKVKEHGQAPSYEEVPRRERLTARASLAELFARVPDKPTRDQRIHDALRVHGYTLQEVGDAAGLHYSTVSRIAKKVADLARATG